MNTKRTKTAMTMLESAHLRIGATIHEALQILDSPNSQGEQFSLLQQLLREVRHASSINEIRNLNSMFDQGLMTTMEYKSKLVGLCLDVSNLRPGDFCYISGMEVGKQNESPESYLERLEQSFQPKPEPESRPIFHIELQDKCSYKLWDKYEVQVARVPRFPGQVHQQDVFVVSKFSFDSIEYETAGMLSNIRLTYMGYMAFDNGERIPGQVEPAVTALVSF